VPYLHAFTWKADFPLCGSELRAKLLVLAEVLIYIMV